MKKVKLIFSLLLGCAVFFGFLSGMAVLIWNGVSFLRSRGWTLWTLIAVLDSIGIGIIVRLFKSTGKGIGGMFRGAFVGAEMGLKGKDAIGTYLSYENASDTINNEYYEIRFSFTDDEGRYAETKSEPIYSEFEAETFAAMGTFPIKYFKNKAMIAVKPTSKI